MASEAFADRVYSFLTSLSLDVDLPRGFEILDPYANEEVRRVVRSFTQKYYAPGTRRIGVWGINPGRFGAGITGLSFTDPVSLKDDLQIDTSLEGRRELSAEFISMVIASYGGPAAFYGDFYLSAFSPLGFLKDGKNINFYDDAHFRSAIVDRIVLWVMEQIAFGLVPTASIVLGTGALRQFVERDLRHQLPFNEVMYLEHPRYIMQYRRKMVDRYVDRYVQTLHRIKAENS